MKKKFFYTVLIFFFVLFFLILGIITSGNYDKQNSLILLLKKMIPSSMARDIRDKVFYIPRTINRNKFLELQLDKYEQDLEGNLFFDEKLKKNGLNYQVKKFFLPFHSLDLSLGWQAQENSKRAHYLEIIDDKVLVISGEAETIFFNKKNLMTEKLNQKYVSNNLKKIVEKRGNIFAGVRDLLYYDDFIYTSVVEITPEGGTLNVYKAQKNFNFLNFSILFENKETYSKGYSLQSGGRLERFKDNNILLSIGFFNEHDLAQDDSSLFGKIISINKSNGDFRILSKGHRNPQGLYFWKEKNIIVNSEHGPKGGDEINFNNLNESSIKNFGWPISSYGEAYSKKKKEIFEKKGYLKKSHSEFGFEEPYKYFTPSIGISEIILNNNTLYVSSLRAESIYIINVKNPNQIIRLKLNNRIRDIKYDFENKTFYLIFENVPSFGFLKML